MKSKDLLEMFLSFFKIGAFTIGGGYAMIPIIQKEFVEEKKWFEEDEFLEIIALSQAVPGAMSINISVYIGYKYFGIIGGIVGCLGTMLPSVITILIIAIFFNNINTNVHFLAAFRALRPAVLGLIFYSVVKLAKPIKWEYKSIFIFVSSLLALSFFNISPIIVITSSIFLGYLFYGREGA